MKEFMLQCNYIISGVNNSSKVKTLNKIADAFEVTIDGLIGRQT